MSNDVKAALLHEPGKPARYDEFDEPEARDGEALVRVHALQVKPADRRLAVI